MNNQKRPIAKTGNLGPASSRRPLAFMVAVLLCACANTAWAGVTVTYEEVGANVVFTASGSINTTDLTDSGNSATGSFVFASSGLLQSSAAGVLWNDATFAGPASFGTSAFIAGSSTGDDFGVREPGSFAGGGVNLPTTYVSGTPISGTLTIAGTIASLGLVPTVTYTWGSGPNADFFTIRDVNVPVELVSFSIE